MGAAGRFGIGRMRGAACRHEIPAFVQKMIIGGHPINR
jgi:hypothetical protein